MKKLYVVVWLFFLTGLLQAQNITEIAVMNDSSSDSQTENDMQISSISDSISCYPDRILYNQRRIQIEGDDVLVCSCAFHYFRVSLVLWPYLFE